MNEAISTARLDEIRETAARWLEGDLKNPTTTSVFRHRAELLAEVDRLTTALADARDDADFTQALANLRQLTADRDRARARVAELETEREQWRASIADAIRGLKQDYRHNTEAWMALGHAQAIARGTKLGLRDAAVPDRADGGQPAGPAQDEQSATGGTTSEGN